MASNGEELDERLAQWGQASLKRYLQGSWVKGANKAEAGGYQANRRAMIVARKEMKEQQAGQKTRIICSSMELAQAWFL